MPADLYVVDASALVGALVDDVQGRVVEQLFADDNAFVAPAHLDAEVLSALGRLHRAGAIPAIDVDSLIDDLIEAPIDRIPIASLMHSAFALRENVAIKDGLYVVLAQRMDAALVTADSRLMRACEQFGLCRVLSAA